MNQLKTVLFVLFLFLPAFMQAQTKQVPDEITFGGIRVKLTPKAREIIQEDLDKLLKYPTYFDKKVARARAHMPVIERVMREEGLPIDFRYLVIQESDLVPDAVSSSNAVGYWQFKKPTGIEMGLRIDGQVDERMNLVSATRAACTYLKRNNYYFDNWVYSLLSYHEGRGGATPQTQKGYYGANKMEVDHRMHWYVLRNFAYKLAFEEALNQQVQGELSFMEYTQTANKTLKDISRETSVPVEDLQAYNKWLLKGSIPADKVYTVLLPVYSGVQLPVTAGTGGNTTPPLAGTTKNRPVLSADSRFTSLEDALRFPVISQRTDRQGRSYITRINGREGTIATAADTKESLARQGGITVEELLDYNDLGSRDAVKAGQPYYFQKKKSKAQTYYHAAQPGETMWSIAQRFGIKLDKLYKKNRMPAGTQPKPGRVLWLRHIRPARVPVEYQQVQVPESTRPVQQAEHPKPKVDIPAPDTKPPVQEDTQPVQQPKQDTPPASTTIKPAAGDTITVTVAVGGEKPKQDEKPPVQEEAMVEEEEEPVTQSIPAQEEPANDGTIVHVVEAGQTLYAISRLYSVKVDAIVSINGLSTEHLHIGQRLLIPGAKAQQAAAAPQVVQERKHVVQPGETLYAISRLYTMPVEKIMEWNDMQTTQLQQGQVLIIRAVGAD